MMLLVLEEVVTVVRVSFVKTSDRFLAKSIDSWLGDHRCVPR